MNNDQKTTLIGVIMAAIVASTVNLERVFMGDWPEIAKLLAVVLMAVFSYYTNKPLPGQPPVEGGQEDKASGGVVWQILKRLFRR